MARYFHQASSEYLSVSSAALTVTPITMACWFFSHDSAPSDDQYLIDIHNTASDRFRDCFSLIASGFGGSRFGIVGLHGTSGGSAQADTNAASGRVWQPFQWQHACAVFAADSDRRVFLNASDKATDTALEGAPSGLNVTTVGRQTSLATGAYVWGRIADAAIWNVALEDAEISLLANLRARPWQIRPESLVAYLSLGPGAIFDVVNAFNFVATGTRAALDPPYYYERDLWKFSSVVAAGFDPVNMPAIFSQMENSGFVGRRYV